MPKVAFKSSLAGTEQDKVSLIRALRGGSIMRMHMIAQSHDTKNPFAGRRLGASNEPMRNAPAQQGQGDTHEPPQLAGSAEVGLCSPGARARV
jgi:hypothetical protein